MEIRVGFEPTNNSFASCSLKPLEYRIMAGIVGFEPTVPASKAGALAAWPYPSILEIRAGLEPVIAAVKGLCPNHLDERTVGGKLSFPHLGNSAVRNENIINSYLQQSRENDQIVYRRQRSPVLPFVDGLRGIETEHSLQIVYGKTCRLAQPNDVRTGAR